uniref:Uncharacterized protein n=1 Tax=Anguilla anguilla TaxID=7936 RepID=A0A0E9SKG3_ANGAN
MTKRQWKITNPRTCRILRPLTWMCEQGY